ncbi:TetR/AcrR family transcriptional regulator [Frigoribacterium sp. PvP032]|uniref:TetR/AcrR family transcriptional regulator n=1 Tax=Frigoribacterium sp. PvP032 TaxID=2806589 RepID=UPI001AE8E77E|nr:TetR/AcrR family transcriptional regulator [Frigoribacterium sp. PvP032]MBP1191501.1 AcrR family transcriptional regulator [Frigoribacterium sp. PvP032]
MPRKPDPSRKPELLGQIVEHLRGRSLATMSFRTLADALGVSTYVFVYHFGNRAELVAEIVRAVVARDDDLLAVDVEPLDPAAFEAHLATAWATAVSDRGRDLRRLETEAALLEVVAGDEQGAARRAPERWRAHLAPWLTGRGVPPANAERAARELVAVSWAAQLDAVLSGDVHQASELAASARARFVALAQR